MNRRDLMRGAAVALGGGIAGRAVAQSGGDGRDPAPTIPGPDANTRVPAFQCPPGTCDAHTHVFGPNRLYPYAANRPYTPPDAGLADFKAIHARLGIERAVIVNATVHGYDNRVVTDAIAQSDGRYLGIANVHEGMSDKELEDLASAGIRGCRYTFLARLGGKADPSPVERIAPRIRGLGWHLDLYVESAALPDLVPVITRLPVPVVLDHMAVPDARKGLEQAGFQALLTLLGRNESVWVKLTGAERVSATGAPFKDAVPFAAKLVQTAPDRVLWGTDWPHPNVPAMPNDGDLVDLVPLYAPDAAQRRKLLVDNPQRLFRFPA